MGHVLYTPADFNSEERQRRNQLYVLVVEGGLDVCKQCGASEIELDRWPTCSDYRDERRRQHNIDVQYEQLQKRNFKP